MSREERKRKLEALNNAKKYGGTGYPVEIVDPNTGKSVVVKPGSAAYSEFFKTKNNVVATPATVDKALDILLENKEQFLIVQDDFGGTVGLVTMEDVIETLLGVEIMDESDEVEDMRELAKQLHSEE